MLAAGSSIQHVADEPICTTYDGTSFQPASANDSTSLQPAPDDLPTMTTNLSGNQYRLLSNTNLTTKSTEPVFDSPKHEYTYKGENHSHSEGDDSNQRHFLFIDYKPYFAPIFKKKHRRRKRSRKPGTRKKEVPTEQDHSSSEKGTEQTPTGNVHFPVMEESVRLSISIHRGGKSKRDVMVVPSQKPKAQADKDKDESSSEESHVVDSVELVNTRTVDKLVTPKLQTVVGAHVHTGPTTTSSEPGAQSDKDESSSEESWVVDSVESVNTRTVDKLVTPKLQTVVGTHVFNGSVIHENNVHTGPTTTTSEPGAQSDKDESSSERSTDIWVVDSIEAENTCAVDELVTPKLKTVLGTHVFNGSVVHENNIATEDMGSVVKPFYELGPPPEKELCNYVTTWYANAV